MEENTNEDVFLYGLEASYKATHRKRKNTTTTDTIVHNKLYPTLELAEDDKDEFGRLIANRLSTVFGNQRRIVYEVKVLTFIF